MTDHAAQPPPADVARPLLCGHCGFDLRYAKDRCPECGRRFDPAHTVDALIPWEQRRHVGPLGRTRTWLRTVRLITFRPRRAARYVARPVSLAAARRFRWMTVWLTFPAVVAVSLCRPARPAFLVAHSWRFRSWRDEPSLVLDHPVSLAVCLTGVLLGMFIASRVTTAFFNLPTISEPRRRRAAALGHYACAPLALAVPAILIPVGAWWANSRLDWAPSPGDPLDILAREVVWNLLAYLPFLLAAVGLLGLTSGLTLLKSATGCGSRRLLLTGLALPGVWAVCLLGLPLLLLLLAALLALMARSLG